jgi:2,5-diamino-6-(ribosylamino)-4(3H)-pyrimidinone 5'-phosphate reductase
MTHYLRSRHDAILVGVGTAVADDPGLNCRIDGAGGYGGEELDGQPRPIVLDPSGRWGVSGKSKVLELAREGKGRAPFVLVARGTNVDGDRREGLEGAGGKYIVVGGEEDGRHSKKLKWRDILRTLSAEGLRSVIIEGGGAVINSLLQPENFELVNSVIVTIAPTWLGVGGVVVSPPRRLDGDSNPMAAARLHHVRWYPFGEDVVMCGNLLP